MISGGLAARGLKPASELAAAREHGDRLRYMAGCRCADCRKANSSYERERKEARANGDWNGIVPAATARRHLKKLSRLGVGRRAVQSATDIADSILHSIRSGERKNIRARTERLILAVTPAAAGDAALIPAAPTWALIGQLLAVGFNKGGIALMLGRKTPALQLNRRRVTVRNAHDIEVLHARLINSDECLVSARAAKDLIRALRAELTPVSVIATAMGSDAVIEDGELRLPNRIPRRLEKEVVALHDRLMS